MKTTLPVGTIIKVREQGKDVLYQISTKTTVSGVGRHLKAGTVIYPCVWKSKANEIVPKKPYTLKNDCDWVSHEPALPETTADQFVAGLCKPPSGIPFEEMPIIQMVYKGHRIMMAGDSMCSVFGGGWSWTWLPKRGSAKLVSPKTKDMVAWTFTDAQAYAQKVLDQYHKESKGSPIPCMVCDPPHYNVEKG